MKFTHALTAFSALAGAAYSAPTISATCVVSTDLSLVEVPSGITQDILFDVASPVGLIVAGLGLSNVAPGLVGLIDSTANNATVPVVGALSGVKEITGVAPELVTQLVQGLSQLQVILENVVDEALTAAVTEVISIVGDLIDLVDNLVDVALDGVSEILGLDQALKLPGIDSAALAVLTQVASPLSLILSTFGLTDLAPGLVSLLALLAAVA